MNPKIVVESTRKRRKNVAGDRISSLSDDIIHKILSFVDIKDTIRTSVLSSKWWFIWTSMPYHNISTEDFSTLPELSNFVTNVLSRRNNLTKLYSVKLSFRGRSSQEFVKRVLDYVFSHNIQQLNVVFLLENHFAYPLYHFSSKSLKHLSLTMQQYRSRCYPVSSYWTSTWELPMLTTLVLHSVTLRDDNADKCVGVFSKCVKLKNLTLNKFKTVGSNGFSIVHPRLSNLTLENCYADMMVINVVAPQLEKLAINFCSAELVISAPNLASLFYKGACPLHPSTKGFPSLEKAHTYVIHPIDATAHQIVCLLQQLHNVKFLKLNLEIMEILSSSVDLILHHPSPFVNLKRLKIYPETSYLVNQALKKVAMSAELKSYFLDSSAGATFTMVLREEIQAQNLMAELRVNLEKENDDSKTTRGHLEQRKTPVESHEPKKLEIGGNMVQIMSSWENPAVQLQRRKEKACFIISKLQRIEELITSLPTSNRANIQPCFSNICAEADIAINNITDCMKIQCDENQSRSSLCFHELATTLEPSS